MTNNIVETSMLSKSYGSFEALKKVGISIGRGEIYGLVGDNGAGKTTLLKMLTGQIFPTSGEFKLFGTHIQKEMEAQRKRMGAIIEAPGFYPQLTVEKNLEYYRIQRGIPGKGKVEEILHVVGLFEHRKKSCKALSLGMRQRLGLAIALLGEPEFLILDEPINGLDPSGIIEIRNLLLKLNREKNITIIISSHLLMELEQIATMYGFLSEGRLLEQVSAQQLKKRCENYIEIAVSDTERYTALLEKELNQNQYKVLPNKTINIYHPKHKIETYSRLASTQNMELLKINQKQAALEDYYMNLKNGGAA